jgi:DNA-binding transcriptional LysR family regulator
MLLAQIEGFLEIVRQGTLSRAAEALCITQPALTARLAALEAELGAPLFVRSRRGMVLTEFGRAFLPYAERAVASLQGGRQLVAELQRGAAGELVLGAAPAVSTYVLPGLLVRYAARHPNVRLIVRTGHSEEILRMALNHEVALGLVRQLQHPDVESRLLYHDELVLVADPWHPFAGRGRIRLAELAEARLIFFDRTSSYFELTNALFRAAGVSPREVMELDNIDAAKKMVANGLGVALLPSTAVAAELATGVLRSVELEDAVPVRRAIVAIRSRHAGPPAPPVAAFLSLLDEIDEVLPRRPGVVPQTPRVGGVAEGAGL